MKIEKFNAKEYYFDLLKASRENLDALGSSSYIKKAFPTQRLETVATWIEDNQAKDLKHGYWPPLFLFLANSPIAEIRTFENDLKLVVEHSTRTNESEITAFLKTNAKEDRYWVSGLFEIFIKSNLIKKNIKAEFDYPLSNGKNVDIKCKLEGKSYYIECTIMTDSDTNRKAWDRFMDAQKVQEKSACSLSDYKDPSPNEVSELYLHCLKFYDKIYDKIAPNLNPGMGQLGEDAQNILAISFYTPCSIVNQSPGIGWALDELFADQPRGSFSPKGIPDVSLSAWLDFKAKDIELDMARYYEKRNEIIAAPRKVSGILLFDMCSLKTARVNYNARNKYKLSHSEMTIFENLFKF
ncbi:MAG: hypothetical protein HQ579_08915, partial [Candidatus Omnitrophica bacterium]|nr:hypothetical protein [Candidatus Omnitrophota bacterium]